MSDPHVLIVEPDVSIADWLVQQLAAGGIKPTVAASGLEALRRARAEEFALAVIDVDMTSEPDGSETADWLNFLFGTPVVIFSMRVDVIIEEERGSSWPAALVTRPDMEELLNTIFSLLSRWWPRKRSAEAAADPATGGLRRHGISASSVIPSGFADLTGREWQIIRDLIETPRADAVAERRHRSPFTVRNHLKSIFRKLRVRSTGDLLSLLIRVSRQRQRI